MVVILSLMILPLGASSALSDVARAAQNVDGFADLYASSMRAHEKEEALQSKSSQQQPNPNVPTQSEAHMHFLTYMMQHSQDFPMLLQKAKWDPGFKSNMLKFPPIATLQDLRNKETELVRWMLTIQSWPGYFDSLLKFAPLIKEILAKEREFSSDYVFYHGHTDELGLIFDLYTEIEDFLVYAPVIFNREKIKSPIQQRVRLRDTKYQAMNFPYKNINEFLDHWENIFFKRGDRGENNMWDDHLDELRFSLPSANIALFGRTLEGFKESSLHFFITSQNVLKVQSLDEVFKRWDLDTKYKDQLVKLYKNFMHGSTGHLLQIFIPADKVNDYVYISTAYGTPVRFKITDTFREKIIEVQGKKVNLSRHMDSKSILDVYRTKPESIRDYTDDARQITADELQARIVLFPSFFDPGNGIKIFRYTTAGLEKEFGADYKKGLRDIVAKMMISHILQHQKEIMSGSDSVMKNVLQAIMKWQPSASVSASAMDLTE